jgi:hypothetical protein
MQNSIQQGGFAAERKETLAMIRRYPVLRNIDTKPLHSSARSYNEGISVPYRCKVFPEEEQPPTEQGIVKGLPDSNGKDPWVVASNASDCARMRSSIRCGDFRCERKNPCNDTQFTELQTETLAKTLLPSASTYSKGLSTSPDPLRCTAHAGHTTVPSLPVLTALSTR